MTARGARPRAWLYCLHGIYGTGRNWASVARALTRARPEWGCVLVDLRLHGSSTAFQPPHTVEACAGDLAVLVRTIDAEPMAVLGHSFGGKVALAYARRAPASLRQLWIVDSGPGASAPRGEAVRVLDAVRGLPAPFRLRHEAVQALRSRGFTDRVARWIVTNLERQEGGLRWRLDPDAVELLLADYFRAELWDPVETPPGRVAIHFVKAESSDALDEEACGRIQDIGRRTGRVNLHRVGGGHWVNVENPGALLALLVAHLP